MCTLPLHVYDCFYIRPVNLEDAFDVAGDDGFD